MDDKVEITKEMEEELAAMGKGEPEEEEKKEGEK